MDPQYIVARLLIDIGRSGANNLTETEAQMRSLAAASDDANAKIRAGAGILSTAMLAGGIAIGIADAASLKFAAEFETAMQKVQGNTDVSNAEIARMREEVLKLGSEGPAPLAQIAGGFEKAANEGFYGADAMKVVTAGWKAAIATGGDVADTVNALATVLHNFHEPASSAEADMGILMSAAAAGNLRLPELVENFSKIGVTAAAIHMPLADAASLFAAVTKATGNAALAQTQLEGALVHIITPTKQAQTVMAELAKTTGIDLAADFKNLAQGTISVTKLMEDARAATHGNATEIMQLFGGIRGGLSMLTLLGDGWNSYLEIQKRVHSANNLVQTEFDNMSKTLGFQLGKMGNDIRELGIAIGDTLIPPVEGIASALDPVFLGLDKVAKEAPIVTDVIALLGVGFVGLGLAIKGTLGILGPYQDVLKIVQGRMVESAGAADVLAAAATRSTLQTNLLAVGMANGVSNIEGLKQKAIAAAQAHTQLQAAQAGATKAVQEAVPAYRATGAAQEAAAASSGRVGAGAEYAASRYKSLDQALATLPTGFGLTAASIETTAAAEGEAAVASGGLLASLTAMRASFAELLAPVGALITSPLGFGALVGIAGVLAYTQIPAFRDQINGLAKDLGVDLYGAALSASDVINVVGENVGHQKAKTDALHEALNTLGQGYKSAASGAMQLATILPTFKVGSDALNSINDAMHLEVQLHHQNAEAAKKHAEELKALTSDLASLYGMDSTRGHAAETSVKGPALSEAQGAKNFGAIVDYTTKAANEALAAFAEGLRTNAQNLGYLRDVAAQYVAGLREATNLQTEAGVRVALSTGQENAAVQKFVDTLNSTATQQINLLAIGMERGSKNIGLLEKNAIDAAKAQKDFQIEQAKATKIVQDAVPPFVDAAKKAKDLAKAHEDAAKAAVDFASKLDKAATDTAAALAMGMFKGDTPAQLDRLSAAAVRAAVAHHKLADDGEKAALRIAKASGDWAGYLSDLQKKLQDQLSTAEGKYVSDKESGNTAALPQDKEAVDEARAKLKALTDTVNNLDGKSKKLVSSFQELSDAAAAKAKAALEAFALAIEQKKPDRELDALKLKAEAAAAGSEKWTKALAEATTIVAGKSHDVAAAMDALKASLDTKLKTAIDQGASDILRHGKMSEQDTLAIDRAQKASDRYAAALAAAESVANSVTQTFATLQSTLQDKVNKGLDALALAILTGRGSVGLLTDALKEASIVEATTSAAMEKAKLDAARSINDFGTLLAALNTRISTDRDKAVGLLDTGQRGLTTNDVSARGRMIDKQEQRVGVPETKIGQDEYDAAIKDLIHSTKELQKHNEDLAVVDTRVDLATGQFGDALKIATDKINTEVSNAIGQATLGIGNWQGALDKAAKDQEAQTQKQDKASDEWVQSEIKAAKAAGDLATAFSLGVSDATKRYTTSLDALAEKYLTHAAVTQTDIDAVRNNKAAVDANTAATWDAVFATSDLATQTQMLDQKFQGIVSNQQTVSSATGSVDSAKLQVISSNSAIEVGELNQLITATQNESAIISAQSGVAQAIGNGELSAVRDQSAIISAQAAIIAATNPAQLKVAQDQLKIAQDQAKLDQVVAAWQARIAEDQVKIAQDKMVADQANAAEQANIAVDNLNIAQDGVRLAEDQLKLTMDMLQVQTIIADALGVVADFGQMIQSDVASINSDQQVIAQDQQALAQDTASAAKTAAEGLLKIAQDQEQLAKDQASAAAATTQGQIAIAYDQNQLARDQAAASASGSGNTALKNQYDTQIAVLEGIAIKLEGEKSLLQYSTTLSASQITLAQDQYDVQIAGVKKQEAQLHLSEDQALSATTAQLQTDQNAILQASYGVQAAQLKVAQDAAAAQASLVAILQYQNAQLIQALKLSRLGSAAGPHWVGSATSGNFDRFLNGAGADMAASPGMP